MKTKWLLGFTLFFERLNLRRYFSASCCGPGCSRAQKSPKNRGRQTLPLEKEQISPSVLSAAGILPLLRRWCHSGKPMSFRQCRACSNSCHNQLTPHWFPELGLETKYCSKTCVFYQISLAAQCWCLHFTFEETEASSGKRNSSVVGHVPRMQEIWVQSPLPPLKKKFFLREKNNKNFSKTCSSLLPPTPQK